MAKPGVRREGREAALQFLFSLDLNRDEDPDFEESDITTFWELRPAKSRTREFATELIEGMTGRLEEIDARITATVENYEMKRLSAVDRNLLRLAVYEILYCESIPPAVSINEAIEIAKRFGTEDSPRFVNGVLDRIRKDAEAISDES